MVLLALNCLLSGILLYVFHDVGYYIILYAIFSNTMYTLYINNQEKKHSSIKIKNIDPDTSNDDIRLLTARFMDVNRVIALCDNICSTFNNILNKINSMSGHLQEHANAYERYDEKIHAIRQSITNAPDQITDVIYQSLEKIKTLEKKINRQTNYINNIITASQESLDHFSGIFERATSEIVNITSDITEKTGHVSEAIKDSCTKIAKNSDSMHQSIVHIIDKNTDLSSQKIQEAFHAIDSNFNKADSELRKSINNFYTFLSNGMRQIELMSASGNSVMDKNSESMLESLQEWRDTVQDAHQSARHNMSEMHDIYQQSIFAVQNIGTAIQHVLHVSKQYQKNIKKNNKSVYRGIMDINYSISAFEKNIGKVSGVILEHKNIINQTVEYENKIVERAINSIGRMESRINHMFGRLPMNLSGKIDQSQLQSVDLVNEFNTLYDNSIDVIKYISGLISKEAFISMCNTDDIMQFSGEINIIKSNLQQYPKKMKIIQDFQEKFAKILLMLNTKKWQKIKNALASSEIGKIYKTTGYFYTNNE